MKRLFRFKKLALSGCIALGLFSAGQLAAATDDLPELGTTAASTLSLDKEIKIGDAYMRMLRGSRPMLNDPLLNQYIDELGHRLVAQANDVKTPFNFFMVEDDEINAFAIFGGYIGVHSGLLLMADNESQLAAVIGHEISHVTQRHLARSIEARRQTSPATMGALLGSLVLALAGAPQAGVAALQTTIAVGQQMSINYTRSFEKEADRIGIALLARSEFDPMASPEFFGKLAQKYRFASKPPPMLLTHPLPESRIADSRARALAYGRRNIAPNLQFHLAKARILVRHTGGKHEQKMDRLDRLEKKKAMMPAAIAYGRALALLQNKQPAKARRVIETLRNNDPDNLFYIDTLTDILLAQKQADGAVALLHPYSERMPYNTVVTLNYANALIEAKQPKVAVDLLDNYVIEKPNDILGWSILQKANRQAGHKAKRHQAKAEYIALFGDYKRALLELYSAHNQIADDQPLEKARIEARIKQMRRERDELKALKI